MSLRGLLCNMPSTHNLNFCRVPYYGQEFRNFTALIQLIRSEPSFKAESSMGSNFVRLQPINMNTHPPIITQFVFMRLILVSASFVILISNANSLF